MDLLTGKEEVVKTERNTLEPSHAYLLGTDEAEIPTMNTTNKRRTSRLPYTIYVKYDPI